MKFVYHTTKTIQIKPCTICSSHQLGLEVERPEWSTTFFFFLSLFHTIKEIFLYFRRVFQSPYTEPVALFMKFPTREMFSQILSKHIFNFVLKKCLVLTEDRHFLTVNVFR